MPILSHAPPSDSHTVQAGMCCRQIPRIFPIPSGPRPQLFRSTFAPRVLASHLSFHSFLVNTVSIGCFIVRCRSFPMCFINSNSVFPDTMIPDSVNISNSFAERKYRVDQQTAWGTRLARVARLMTPMSPDISLLFG